MRLVTLGGLELEGSAFSRTKPLLLLGFLTLEGVQERRYAAELFWPAAADPLNSLSRALSQLRKGAPGVVEADDQRVWSVIGSDVDGFRAALTARDDAEAVALYHGPFLAAVHLSDWGAELEEWLYATRERLAAEARGAQLRLAEDEAARGRFAEAARLAEAALELPGAAEPDPELLPGLYTLLLAGDSVLAARVRDEAESYGIELRLGADAARARLRSAFLGRERERRVLDAMQPGQWAWLQGGAGMGKTALLRGLDGSYLPGRSGLPYATLEPLLEGRLQDGEEALLRRLARIPGRWLFDNWEWMDSESQRLLRRLRDLRPLATVTISSRLPPAMRVDHPLELAPLTPAELAGHDGLHDATGGLPALVGARLRGEPLDQALEARLQALSEAAADVYLTLTLLDGPDLPLARRALDLRADDMAAALERLVRMGLIDPSGAPRATRAASEYLDAHPIHAARLALASARQLSGVTSHPLYQRSRLLWEDRDRDAARDAALAWADELLRRGFPQRAVETLESVPAGEGVSFARARALERAGRFREALEHCRELEPSPEVAALVAGLYWRLGEPERAETSARAALVADVPARAEALQTLGALALSRGRPAEAEGHFRRAASLWQALGVAHRRADALNNLAIARSLGGENADEAFDEALAAAGDNLRSAANVHLNRGKANELRGDLSAAEREYRRAAELAEEAGASNAAARARNNLGVIRHKQGRKRDAAVAYGQALQLAQRGGERLVLGAAMANLAELNGDRDAWEEALFVLESSGHAAEAAGYREELPADHPFRQTEGAER